MVCWPCWWYLQVMFFTSSYPQWPKVSLNWESDSLFKVHHWTHTHLSFLWSSNTLVVKPWANSTSNGCQSLQNIDYFILLLTCQCLGLAIACPAWALHYEKRSQPPPYLEALGFLLWLWWSNWGRGRWVKLAIDCSNLGLFGGNLAKF